ncbi:MAG TPA: DedA family protein [Tepidisphaeraceae bacterium]|nr:DedA family protein [Tepidisphaeraceae bacterium]
MDFLKKTIDVFLHLDRYLNTWAGDLGGWLYALLFAVIFCETGLVVTPFLPGDSLLFAVGALAADPASPINVGLVGILMTVAAILGDAVNYAIGKRMGPKVFRSETSRLLNKDHLLKAQRFYEKYGGKTIILARFVPIIRTFAPFVAGVGRMGYGRFALYNVVGGIVWVWSFLLAGYWFGNRPWVKDQFHYVILAIIAISLLPVAWEFWQARRTRKHGGSEVLQATTIGDSPPVDSPSVD